MILADDQGWGDLSAHGNTQISTPHIDHIAKEGVQFSHFYVQPVCSPTRAELLTGRYHLRSGVLGTSAGEERIDLDEILVSQLFQEAGYRTACFGKWHSGSQHPYHPNSRGFDEFYGFTSGHWGHYFDVLVDHNGNLKKTKGYLPDDLTSEALDFIGAADQPFFIFLSYNTPHAPMQVPDEHWDKFENIEIIDAPKDDQSMNHARAALAMVENIDYNVGRVHQHLTNLGKEDHTIIIYMTDNGPNGQRYNGNMKGMKGSTDEGGVRSPLFIKYPDELEKGRTITTVAGITDITPTLLELCDITPPDIAFDGISLAPLMIEGTPPPTNRALFHHWNKRTSIRTQDYRLDHEGRLYNIKTDPEQKEDISSTFSVKREELITLRSNWESKMRQELSNDEERPFTIGMLAQQKDYLPVRDATATGNITRSNRYPNDSFFSNWKSSKGDSIIWDIDVLASGAYTFELYYTCAATDTGCQITLASNSTSIQKVITEPHDPALVGMKEDRALRKSSYVKDFLPTNLGEMILKEGRQQIKLYAKDLPGELCIDINRISTTRL